jgi:hypothetical protein
MWGKRGPGGLCKNAYAANVTHYNHRLSSAVDKNLHLCETCNLTMENTGSVVDSHNKSPEHQRIHMWLRDSDSRSDGQQLAANAAKENNGKMWVPKEPSQPKKHRAVSK